MSSGKSTRCKVRTAAAATTRAVAVTVAAMAVLMAVALPGAGCTAAPADPAAAGKEGRTMTTTPTATSDASGLAGHWQKVTVSACSQAYPDRIEFRSNGLYFAENDPPRVFSTWDVGTHAADGPGRVKISTANDAVVSYRLTFSGDTVAFVDAGDCRFEYRRSQ